MNQGEAYNTGYEAAAQGEKRTACPYAAGTWDAEQWLDGWDDLDDCTKDAKEPSCDACLGQ